jgi:SAM-dependent methyltransferase
MTDVPELHEQRDRADSFGAIAETYDRYRPAYSEELMDRLAGLRPEAVLDIGAGTGKASRQLLDRGLQVLAVEPDKDMAAIARRHGVEVEVVPFETWDDRGRTFDLVVSGQAWHWVDPNLGAPKVLRLLRANGSVCFFWNYDDLERSQQARADGVYRRLAPELVSDDPHSDDDVHATALRRTGCFCSVVSEEYPREAELATEEWIARLGTHSALLLLGEQRLTALQHELRTALGERVRLVGGTYVVWAKR